MVEQISNVGDLIDRVRQARLKSQKTMWFRGQRDLSWLLLPSLLRSDHRLSEGSLVARFKQSAAMLVSDRPSGEFDWIFLMQHYGVPTRLLDWTENPLVALYFATEDSALDANDVDAAFWILRPSELNKNAHIEDKDESDYIPSFDDEEVKGYSLEQVRSRRGALYPIATIATRNNARIQAQSGTFTIHHKDKIPIESISDGSHCEKFCIPAGSIAAIREELAILGMSRFTLFPEMASIGGLIRGLL